MNRTLALFLLTIEIQGISFFFVMFLVLLYYTITAILNLQPCQKTVYVHDKVVVAPKGAIKYTSCCIPDNLEVVFLQQDLKPEMNVLHVSIKCVLEEHFCLFKYTLQPTVKVDNFMILLFWIKSNI